MKVVRGGGSDHTDVGHRGRRRVSSPSSKATERRGESSGASYRSTWVPEVGPRLLSCGILDKLLDIPKLLLSSSAKWGVAAHAGGCAGQGHKGAPGQPPPTGSRGALTRNRPVLCGRDRRAVAGMTAERGAVLGLKEEERRMCSRGSRKTERCRTGGKGRERGSRQSVSSASGARVSI